MASDLNGIWELDYNRSDSPEAVLVAQGVGWATRKVVCGLNITETLTISEKEVKMEKATKVKNTCEILKLHESEEVDDTFVGRVVQTVTVSENGGKIVINLDGKDGAKTVTTRSLIEDNKTMKLNVSYTDKKGKNTEITRYFTRK
eukprot:CAMPEP_0201486594 /NCGR_PEP_ID=MMETSP0151_2-20130828/10659_1 /ASSEMBLY_ACC=CAM_ASM_000257 /TAXON_ID=200890 /ORGANISM="Paramoeba atlantica, Strain 621/1 / CCAP 1560/9" /LENGTH=144 /DNA_ID=CAMNT_0047871323 /DNA_START=109 /DNA_END=543 /DNA_ORIENTATION=-